MWRGDGRLGISVSAPFVWRCLTGAALAPFPHPAHRTGRADFPHPALGQGLTPSPMANRFRRERFRRVGLAPTGKRRLVTAHPHCRPCRDRAEAVEWKLTVYNRALTYCALSVRAPESAVIRKRVLQLADRARLGTLKRKLCWDRGNPCPEISR